MGRTLLLACVPMVAVVAVRLSCSSRLSACDAMYYGGCGVPGLLGPGVAASRRVEGPCHVRLGCRAGRGRGLAIEVCGRVYPGRLIRAFVIAWKSLGLPPGDGAGP